ncbi:MAG: hypothetical protein OXP73_15030 [Chloroflexota bacterium]|nr:hypothetical protein [Chloroflexota bacterium]
MSNDTDRPVKAGPRAVARIQRRRALAFGAAALAAVVAAACAPEDEGAGTRDNPFPYSEERTARLRTRM